MRPVRTATALAAAVLLAASALAFAAVTATSAPGTSASGDASPSSVFSLTSPAASSADASNSTYDETYGETYGTTDGETYDSTYGETYGETGGETYGETGGETSTAPTLDVDVTELSLLVGDTATITATSDGTVTFESSDTSVVTVDADGLVTAVGAGSATITVTATSDAGLSTTAYVAVTVTKRTPTLSADDIDTVFTTERIYISYTTDSDGTVTFTSEDTTKLGVNSAGGVLVKRTGSHTVTVTVSETDTYYSASVIVTVTVTSSVSAPSAKSITRDGADITITWGKVSGANGYVVFRKQVGDSSWTSLDTTESTVTTYTDTGVATKSGVTWWYRVRAWGLTRYDLGDYSDILKCRRLDAPASLAAENIAGAVELVWEVVDGASGYYVFRGGTRVATVAYAKRRSWRDSSPVRQGTVTYEVAAYHSSTSSTGDVVSCTACFVQSAKVRGVQKKVTTTTKRKKVRLTAAERESSGGRTFKMKRVKIHHVRATISWKRVKGAGGYQVQWSTSPIFNSKRSRAVKNRTSLVVRGLKWKQAYFVRVRAFMSAGGKRWTSVWSHSANTKRAVRAKTVIVKAKGKPVELRARAKQSVSGYNTVQGSCTDGTFGYYVLCKTNSGKCKIAKIRLKRMRLVKVSGELSIFHGNGITYNKSTKKLVVACAGTAGRKIATVNAKTLRLESVKTVSILAACAGAGTSVAKSQSGYSGIAWCGQRKRYVLSTGYPQNLVICDSELEPIRYVTCKVRGGKTLQSIDCTVDYVFVGWSSSGGNFIMVYNWQGTFITRIGLGATHELESIYHVGRRMYFCTYQTKKINYVRRFWF